MFGVAWLSELLIVEGAVQPCCEVEPDQPCFLLLAGGHVLQHFHEDLAEDGAAFAATALGVLGPVEVVHFEVGFVLTLRVALGIAAARFCTVADWCVSMAAE